MHSGQTKTFYIFLKTILPSFELVPSPAIVTQQCNNQHLVLHQQGSYNVLKDST